MILSMVVSFLLARRLHGVTYVFLVISNVLLISFLSAGFPSYSYIPERLTATAQSGILIDNPLPLSFPIYASLNREILAFSAEAQYYELHFLTLMLYKNPVQSNYQGNPWLDMSWGDYILFYSFFILVDTVGAAIGYWISKTKMLPKRR